MPKYEVVGKKSFMREELIGVYNTYEEAMKALKENHHKFVVKNYGTINIKEIK